MSAKRASRKPRISSATADAELKFLEPTTIEELRRTPEQDLSSIRYFLDDGDRSLITQAVEVEESDLSDATLHEIVEIVQHRIDRHWASIYHAIEADLSGCKDSVKELVEEYFEWQAYESSALFIQDVYKELQEIHRACRSLTDIWLKDDESEIGLESEEKQAVRYKNKEDDESEMERDLTIKEKQAAVRYKNEVAGEARYRIRSELGRRRDPGSKSVGEEVSECLVDLVTACHSAQRALEAREEQGGSFREGDAWRVLIKQLTEWARSQGLPVAVSKSPRSGEACSPFVRFIWALQQAFPPELRRAQPYPSLDQSYVALAKGIAAARAKKATGKRPKRK